MMHKSPMMKILGMVTWVITGLFSLNALTAMYGVDGVTWLMNMMPGASMLIIWIIGLSGLISLAMFVKVCFLCCPGCGECPCTCPSNNYNKM
jgi:uncharacterized membrane protein YuzA (DUF378 family)